MSWATKISRPLHRADKLLDQVRLPVERRCGRAAFGGRSRGSRVRGRRARSPLEAPSSRTARREPVAAVHRRRVETGDARRGTPPRRPGRARPRPSWSIAAAITVGLLVPVSATPAPSPLGGRPGARAGRRARASSRSSLSWKEVVVASRLESLEIPRSNCAVSGGALAAGAPPHGPSPRAAPRSLIVRARGVLRRQPSKIQGCRAIRARSSPRPRARPRRRGAPLRRCRGRRR